MAQDLTVNIKTTSDVPQAMDKAKTATTGFAKQVEDIQKKFSTSFKDIFLSFVGPMALLTGALALIGKMISDNEKKRAEANQAAIDGTNELMSAEDKYWARKNARENKAIETKEQADMNRLEVTRQFTIRERERAFEVMSPEQKLSLQTGGNFNDIIKDPEYQKRIQALIAEDMKKNPITEEAAKEAEKKAGTFKGPEGFGAVIGVGANPVLEKMTRQNEIMEEIKIILQEQSLINRGSMVPSPFTERVPVTLQKIGAV